MRWKEHERNYRLRFDNGISVEILRSGQAYGGVGQVRWGRRKLRSAELPVLPLIATPGGHEVTRLEFDDIARDDDSVTLSLRPYVSLAGRTEWVGSDGQDRWNAADWARPAERDRGGAVQVTLSAVRRTIAGLPFVGFSYAYRFHSRKYHVYRIHDRSTWELGGWATGNSFWMQGPFAAPRAAFASTADAYSSAWCDGDGRHVQQFLPLFGALQGFTFQFDRQRILLTAFDRPFHCLSLFEKQKGRNYVVHWHQLSDDLHGSVEFPALQVLCAEAEAEDERDRVNQYCAIREELQREFREQAGVAQTGTAAAGCLLEDGADVKAVQRGIDALAHAACQTVFVPGLLSRESADGRKDPVRFARQVVERAHSRSMEVALALEDCCRGGLGGPDAPEPVSLAEALRDDGRWKALMQRLRWIKRELEVEAIFAENPLETVADQFGWSDGPSGARAGEGNGTVRSLHERKRELLQAVQRMGYECVLCGVGALATPGLSPGYASLKGSEFLFRDAVLRFPAEDVAGARDDPADVYFRGCAHRLCYMPSYAAGGAGTEGLEPWWRPEFSAVNRAYQAVREYMEQSHVLPEDRGVLWRGAAPDVLVLWAFRKFEWDAGPDAQAFDVMDSAAVEPDGRALAVRPLRVYLLQDAKAP